MVKSDKTKVKIVCKEGVTLTFKKDKELKLINK
jgi:hypothetical protein